MKKLNLIILASLLMFVMISCDKDDEMEEKSISLNINGLEDLGNDFVYEGWLIVDGAPVSTGTFTVDASGSLSKTSFSLEEDMIDDATKFVLSIEPKVDSDPAPSNTKILAGDFTDSSAGLTISPVGDFSSSAGKYILATPTNGADTDEKSGIWFLDLSNGAPPTVGLTLPDLPSGWRYEGWVVINGTPVTTGTFSKTDATDDAAPFSGDTPLGMVNPGGFFPGEDFLKNAPMGLSFPTDISGGKAVISVEPYPDNSTHPFTLKPLVQDIPADAMDHVTYNMGTNLNFPTGTATKN